MLRKTWANVHLGDLFAEHGTLSLVDRILSSELVRRIETSLYIVASGPWRFTFLDSQTAALLFRAKSAFTVFQVHSRRTSLLEFRQVNCIVCEAWALVSKPAPLLHKSDPVLSDLHGASNFTISVAPAIMAVVGCGTRRRFAHTIDSWFGVFLDLHRLRCPLIRVELIVARDRILLPVYRCLILDRRRHNVFGCNGFVCEKTPL